MKFKAPALSILTITSYAAGRVGVHLKTNKENKEMKFNLSINKNMINKANPSLYGWRNAEFTGDELAEHIRNGFAFSPGILKPNASGRKPSIKDIQSAQILAIDIDNDIKSYNSITKKYDKRKKTEQEGYWYFAAAKFNNFIIENALLIYTTPSHKSDFERFRIVFVIENTITNPEDYRKAITVLIDKFGGDKSCSNIDRLFYGHRDCELEYFGKILSTDILKSNYGLL